MDTRTIKAYDELVPAEQLVVDAMIHALYSKEIKLRNVVKEVEKYLSTKETPNEQ
jgi:hypothetical protein